MTDWHYVFLSTEGSPALDQCRVTPEKGYALFQLEGCKQLQLLPDDRGSHAQNKILVDNQYRPDMQRRRSARPWRLEPGVDC